MALPHRRQRLPRFIKYYDLTRADIAEKLGTNVTRVANLCQGHAYPSPDEIAALEALFFPIPIENVFEKDMLTYRFGPWPPPSGPAALKAELERANARLDSQAGE